MESMTIAVVVSTLIFKTLEKSGEKLGEALASKIGLLISMVREKLKSKSMEGVLIQAQENPTDTNRQMFQTILGMQVSQDETFAKELEALINELGSNSQVNQILLKGIDVSGNAEIGDVSQTATSHSSTTQEAVTDFKVGGDLKIGDVKQQS